MVVGDLKEGTLIKYFPWTPRRGLLEGALKQGWGLIIGNTIRRLNPIKLGLFGASQTWGGGQIPPPLEKSVLYLWWHY